jgi:transcriptional regulator with XRE-family HTH domain
MASTGSTGPDELSRTLRLLRSPAGERGLTLAEAAKRTGFSTAKISRIERGKNIPSPDDVIKFANAYRVTPDARERLATLANEVKAANRRVVLTRRANRPEFQGRMRRIEASSEQLREFSPIIVPGYLQTAEYMRAIFLGSGTTPEDAERAVANRLLRQAALDEPGRRITILNAYEPVMITLRAELAAAFAKTS